MRKILVATAVALCVSENSIAETVPADGYLYVRRVLDELTEACVARGVGGVYVGVGPALAFPTPSGKTRSILFVSDSGNQRTVATGLNAIGDCAYDVSTDTLYVTDNGAEYTGATTGDTVFAIDGSATNVPVDGLEVVPADSIPNAFSVSLYETGLLVSDATGAGAGSVIEIDLTGVSPVATTFIGGLDYAGGITWTGSHVIVAQALDPTFESEITQYFTNGTFNKTISPATYAHGSIDVAKLSIFATLLATGSPTIVVIEEQPFTITPLVTGLDGGTGFDAFGGGVTVDSYYSRIDFLASSFSGADDDKSIHTLVPVDALAIGGGGAGTDCVTEIYGIRLGQSPTGRTAKVAYCIDGDSCDADGTADGVCTYPLGLCMNVNDTRLPDCTPSAVASVEVTTNLESPELTAFVASVQQALPVAESTCIFSDGVKVPVRTRADGSTRTGRAAIKFRTVTDEDNPAKDTDAARFACIPAAS
jgi:hypothetical protein